MIYGSKYSAKDDATILALYKSHSVGEIAVILKRTKNSVHNRMGRLGVRFKDVPPRVRSKEATEKSRETLNGKRDELNAARAAERAGWPERQRGVTEAKALNGRRYDDARTW